MEIIFNRELSRVHDAMEGLVQCYKDNYKLLYEEYNLNLNKAAEEAIHLIGDRIAFDIPQSDLFFSKDTGIAVAFTTSRFIPSDLSVDNFVDYLRGLSDKEARLIVLSNIKPQEVSYEEICDISQDETKVLDFLRRLPLPSSIKWEAFEFFSDVGTSMKGLIALVEKYLPVYKKVIKKNIKLIEAFENDVANRIKSEGEAYYTKLLNGSISLDANQVIAGTLFFSSRSLICTTVGEKLYIFVGLDFEETIKLISGDGETAFFISVYKNLSDKTRLQILNLLKDKEYYGLEIAEKVGITLATVSYHMSYLLASNLVSVEKVGQKGYYTLKKNTLKKAIDFLQNNFNL